MIGLILLIIFCVLAVSAFWTFASVLTHGLLVDVFFDHRKFPMIGRIAVVLGPISLAIIIVIIFPLALILCAWSFLKHGEIK